MPTAAINGYQHHWEESGSGQPLVLIHGAAGSGKMLEKFVPALSQHFRVIVPDMRGLGQSERVSAAEQPVDAWVQDLRGLQDHLGLGPLNVYGLTVGGRVAMRLAVESPERVRSLIVDMPVMFNEQSAQAGVRKDVVVEQLSDARRKQLQSLHGDEWESATRFYEEFRARADWMEYFDLREDSKKISARVLIMRGDAPGDAYSAEHAFMLYRNVPGAWLWIRPNTVGALLRNDPEVAQALIRDFVLSDGEAATGSTY